MKFKTRISLYYLVANAVIMALVFLFLYFLVRHSIYNQLDNYLEIEAQKHVDEIGIDNTGIHFLNKKEWEEREHRVTEVNPVFIQVLDADKKVADRSPNLKMDSMQMNESVAYGTSYDAQLNAKPVRQMNMKIEKDDMVHGYIISGIPMSGQLETLIKLRNTLLVLFPIILIGLFFISRFLAGKSINPINDIILATNRITNNNLDERVPEPKNKDELYQLSAAINELLARIENAVKREKQFTSDASHELRTPLAVLKGTFEVLLRKPRTEEQYKEKISFALNEINQISLLTEQLLTMARLDPGQITNTLVSLDELLENLFKLHQNEIQNKNLKIIMQNELRETPEVNLYLSQLILGNVLSNAIKFSPSLGKILLQIKPALNHVTIEVQDDGPGINEEDMNLIFNPFYRSMQNVHVPGSGLGLSIAKKAADILGAEIRYFNLESGGTLVYINIPFI
ncbi:MAG: ATP-binding protein [Flavobacteriaceae bacterium]|nr:ATP-binding protein [Flavobacteriaceae bacterium]